jgi:N6-adenosine-specific RNA methylase IME4
MALTDADRYGKLLEDVHVSGYTFERACRELEHLLEGERWKLGGRFKQVNDFLDNVRLDKFRALAENRKRIAVRIKELQPKASNRRIAKALGVGKSTIHRDSVPNGTLARHSINSDAVTEGASVPNGTPRELTGTQAAALVDRRATARADRLERVAADEQRVLRLAPIIGKFRTLVFDPAWEYDWLSIAGRAKPGYAMQTHEQLLALDVRQWADGEAGTHLYVWTTNNFMARACELVAHWGFQHRVVITWIKPPPFGLGSYFRNSTEHILFATLGETTTRHAAASVPTHFEAPRGEHSEKPEAFYDIVRAASYPPYGEGNQRESRPDFTNLFESIVDAATAAAE